MLVDSHCHLDRLKSAPDHESLVQLIDQAALSDVKHFLCVNVCLADFPSMQQRMLAFNQVSLSCGIHPLHTEEEFDVDKFRQYLTMPKVIAVGETGLDYFYGVDKKAKQCAYFEQQVALALEINKPLIIHTRDAREDTLAILRNGQADKVGGVLHCFTENWEMAKAALDMGFYISVSGIVTFKNAGELRTVIRKIPKDRLLVETDSPYLAPLPHRGRENRPTWVRDVAEFVANLRGETYPELAEYTTRNFFNLFTTAKRND